MSAAPTSETHEHLLRPLAPEVLALLVRRYGPFDACEDAVQEALLAAVRQWPETGVPENPRAWLLTAASRRLIDEFRSDAARRRREERDALRTNTPGRTGSRRLARAAVPVLPRGAVSAIADRSHPACGRRSDDRRDRERVPRPRGDDGAADQPREANDRRGGRALRAAGYGPGRTSARRRSAHALSDLQRGLHRQLRRSNPAARARARGDPPGADAA